MKLVPFTVPRPAEIGTKCSHCQKVRTEDGYGFYTYLHATNGNHSLIAGLLGVTCSSPEHKDDAYPITQAPVIGMEVPSSRTGWLRVPVTFWLGLPQPNLRVLIFDEGGDNIAHSATQPKRKIKRKVSHHGSRQHV